jgi:hypothetical protein
MLKYRCNLVVRVKVRADDILNQHGAEKAVSVTLLGRSKRCSQT